MQEFNNKYNHWSYMDIAGFNAYLTKVFLWMFMGLAVSFLTAFVTANSASLFRFLYSNYLIILILFGIEFFLVSKLSRRAQSLSFQKAALMFILYSFINGLTLSFIFAVYSISAIAAAFLSAAALFGVMAIYGRMTKRDLSSYSTFLIMGLFGIIIASIINLFFRSGMMGFVVSIIGIIVFAGLTAWDVQKLKQYYINSSHVSEEASSNFAITGALSLYLDFINIFLYLLRLYGGRD